MPADMTYLRGEVAAETGEQTKNIEKLIAGFLHSLLAEHKNVLETKDTPFNAASLPASAEQHAIKSEEAR
jgi:hypothetical protein